MFFINNPNLRKLEAFMQDVPNFPPKGVKVDLDKLEDEILLFEVEKVIVSFKQHKGKERIIRQTVCERGNPLYSPVWRNCEEAF